MRTFLAALLVVTSVALAQRGGGRGPSLVSPEVQADRKVTFRLRAPNAQAVTLNSDWTSAQTMTKDDNGVWSVTVGPLDPGPAIYSFSVDGNLMPDPLNPRVKLRAFANATASAQASIVDVLGDGSEPWVPRDVPHGTVDINYHIAKTLGNQMREYRVYTPPGYVQDQTKRYPVLYLLHGNNDLPPGWFDVGRANQIFDNLIADKKMVPMIVIVPFGHAQIAGNNDELIEKYVIEEVMPQAEKQYRTLANRENRAIAGYSMGGGHTIRIGLGHLDLFSHVAGFSSAGTQNIASRYESLLKDPDGTNAKLKLLWFGCGKQDSLFNGNQQMINTLNEAKIRNTWHAIDGVHNFVYWRKALIEIAPRLFQTK